MSCPKCDGFLVMGWFIDVDVEFQEWRCVNCGLRHPMEAGGRSGVPTLLGGGWARLTSLTRVQAAGSKVFKKSRDKAPSI